MDNFDKVLELLVRRVSEALALKLNSADYSKNLSEYTNDAGFITKSVNDLVNYYKKNETYTKSEVDGLVKALNSVSMKVVERLPDRDQEANVIYLIPAQGPNSENAKDEYIWIESRWELIGTTRIATAQVHKATNTSLETDDQDVIREYFASGAGRESGKAAGDVFVVTKQVGGVVYEVNTYVLDKAGTTWEKTNGQMNSTGVVFQSNLMLAGKYTQIGGITKTETEHKELDTKGKSVEDVFKMIFTKKEQPEVTAEPAVTGFELNGATAVEVGTQLSSVTFGTAELSAGSYTFGPATGITATSWQVDRVADPVSLNSPNIAQATSGTDNNGGSGFIVGDGDESNVVKSLKYTITASYNAGAVANDSTGAASHPQIKIEAGTKTQTTKAYTGFRKFFYGSRNAVDALDSSKIRALTNSDGPYKAQDITFTVPKGQKAVIIACISTATGLTKAKLNSAFGVDITEVFKKETVQVEGASGYTAKDYNVWVWKPANAFEKDAELTITLG